MAPLRNLARVVPLLAFIAIQHHLCWLSRSLFSLQLGPFKSFLFKFGLKSAATSQRISNTDADEAFEAEAEVGVELNVKSKESRRPNCGADDELVGFEAAAELDAGNAVYTLPLVKVRSTPFIVNEAADVSGFAVVPAAVATGASSQAMAKPDGEAEHSVDLNVNMAEEIATDLEGSSASISMVNVCCSPATSLANCMASF